MATVPVTMTPGWAGLGWLAVALARADRKRIRPSVRLPHNLCLVGTLHPSSLLIIMMGRQRKVLRKQSTD